MRRRSLTAEVAFVAERIQKIDRALRDLDVDPNEVPISIYDGTAYSFMGEDLIDEDGFIIEYDVENPEKTNVIFRKRAVKRSGNTPQTGMSACLPGKIVSRDERLEFVSLNELRQVSRKWKLVFIATSGMIFAAFVNFSMISNYSFLDILLGMFIAYAITGILIKMRIGEWLKFETESDIVDWSHVLNVMVISTFLLKLWFMLDSKLIETIFNILGLRMEVRGNLFGPITLLLATIFIIQTLWNPEYFYGNRFRKAVERRVNAEKQSPNIDLPIQIDPEFSEIYEEIKRLTKILPKEDLVSQRGFRLKQSPSEAANLISLYYKLSYERQKAEYQNLIEDLNALVENLRSSYKYMLEERDKQTLLALNAARKAIEE